MMDDKQPPIDVGKAVRCVLSIKSTVPSDREHFSTTHEELAEAADALARASAQAIRGGAA